MDNLPKSRFQKRSALLPDLVAITLIILAAAVASFPSIEYGAPSGHSISYNLAWLANFSSQLLQGDLYPRWLENMNHGEGSPVFFFYAPLPFYISTLGVVLFHTSKIGIQLAAGEWILLALSGITFYLFMRQRVNAVSASIGAVLYMLMPYHFEIDLWRRQAIGELANYVWMPLSIYFIDRLHKENRGIVGLAVSYSALIFSHLPTALLFSPFIALYTTILYTENRSQRFLYNIFRGLFFGIVIAGIYLVPALFTEHYISTDKLWNANFDFHRWFLPILGSNRSAFTERLFVVLVSTTIMALVCWLSAWKYHKTALPKSIFPWVLFVGLAWFVMLPISAPIWQITPFLWKVQFPWRVSIVLDFATAVIVTYTAQRAVISRDSLSFLVASFVGFSLLYCSYTGRAVIGNLDPLEDTHYIAYRDAEVSAGHDAPEYTTLWTMEATHGKSADTVSNWRDQLSFDKTRGAIKIDEWKPREILLSVDLKQSAELTIRQFYYPGWRAHMTDDDRDIDIKPGKSIGLIRLMAPAGHYQLTVEMGPLWQEVVGDIASAIGLLWLISCLRLNRRGHAQTTSTKAA